MAQTPNSQTQTSQINKKLIFSAHKTNTNYTSKLKVEIEVKDSYFSKLSILYDEGESFIGGYFDKHFEFIAYADYRYVNYEEHFANANVQENRHTKFGYTLKSRGEEDPFVWEDKYVSDEYADKWFNNKMSIEEVRQMVKDIIEYFEPQETEKPEEAFIDALLKFVKSIIDSGEYRVDVEIQDIKE